MKKGINDMNQQLPAYLRMQTHAHARPDQSIVCGQVRVTVITPCLIRFEEGAWTDDATLTLLHVIWANAPSGQRSRTTGR